jgi:hypothetical protein
MGWFSDFVSNPIGTLGDTGQKLITTVKEHPIETAAIAAGSYYGYGALTAESGLAAMAPVSDAVAVPVSQIAPWAPASSNAAFEAALSSGTSSGWSAGQIASTVGSGLNLATSATKLSLLGKSMDAQSATANGLTGALAPSPIQTPSGLITTTPQGPLMAGTQAASGGFMGMDTQTLFVIAAGIAAIYYFSKHGK